VVRLLAAAMLHSVSPGSTVWATAAFAAGAASRKTAAVVMSVRRRMTTHVSAFLL
jgi:hypothetical protein